MHVSIILHDELRRKNNDAISEDAKQVIARLEAEYGLTDTNHLSWLGVVMGTLEPDAVERLRASGLVVSVEENKERHALSS